MDIISILFYVCCLTWTVISILGYLIYKFGFLGVQSWEEGVHKLVTSGFTLLYEEMTGQLLPEEIVNTALILNNDEVLELVKRLSDHPYETPSLEYYCPNSNGISWYDIRAVDLAPRYQNLSNEEIAKIAFYIIQNYIMEGRGLQAFIDIKIATPTRLYLAIALSEKGRKFLEQQNTAKHEEKKAESLIIEETR